MGLDANALIVEVVPVEECRAEDGCESDGNLVLVVVGTLWLKAAED